MVEKDKVYIIRSYEDYKNFIEKYPQYDTIDLDRFGDSQENEPYLMINVGTSRPPQWHGCFVDLITGEKISITEKQAVQYMLMCVGIELDQAWAGVAPWIYNPAWTGGKRICNLKGDCYDFYQLFKQFIPQDSDIDIIKDSFYRNMVRSMAGWRDDARNFRRSKVFSQLTNLNEIKKEHFEHIQPGKGEYTESEAEDLRLMFLEEELALCGWQTQTAAQRSVIYERVGKRLLEETGYKYSATTYDVTKAEVNFDIFQCCKGLAPDVWDAVESILDSKSTYFNSYSDSAQAYAANTEDMVGLDIKPGSSSGRVILQNEFSNPIGKTRQYLNSVKRGIKNFEIQFNLEGKFENETEVTDDLYKTIKAEVLAIDAARDLDDRSNFSLHFVVQSLCLYYLQRKRTYERLKNN